MPEVVIKELEKYPVRIFVGGCVERGEGSSFRAKAHAHNFKKDPYFGWICFRSAKRLLTPSGKPSRLLMEEVAHILTPNHWHDDAFREKMKELGQPITRFKKKKRPPLPGHERSKSKYRHLWRRVLVNGKPVLHPEFKEYVLKRCQICGVKDFKKG